MVKRNNAMVFIALCFVIPLGHAAADDVAIAPALEAVYHSETGERDALGLHRPHRGHYPYYERHHYAPFPRARDHGVLPRHARYYGMHGYSSPTWRYPRSLYYHHHIR